MLLRPFILFLVLSLISLKSNGQKFAFVDSEYILEQMEGYQKAQKQIDDLAAQWQKELDQKMIIIEQKSNELKKNELLLPEDTRIEKELEITTLQDELRKFQTKKFGVGGDLFRKRKELIQPIQRKVFKAIQSLAKDNNYLSLIHISEPTRPY